jgi:hypothetical protein
MFWVALSLYLLLRTYDNWSTDSLWAYAGAGFVCGLATSAKYNGMILIVPLLLVPILRIRSLDEALTLRVIIGPLMMVVGFLVGTPYAILDIPQFLHWFGYSINLYNAPERIVAMPVWLWHLRYHLTNPHAPVILMGILGAILSFRHWGSKRAVVVNSFAFTMLLVVLGQTNAQTRMWLPTATLFILWSAVIADLLMQRVGHWLNWRRRSPHWSYALLFFLLAPFLYFSLHYGMNFRRGDVRTAAREWIEVNIPPGSSIAVDYFHPNLDPSIWPLRRTFRIYDYEVKWYKDQGVEYLVLNEALSDFGQQSPDAYGRYQDLLQNVCEVGSVRGPFVATVEFSVKIYRVGQCTP